MIIKDSWLVDFIEIKVQGRIPIFQRSYSWEEGNCLRLLDDIVNVAQDKNRDCHFIGSIIYENTGRESGVAIKHIIDGQQRLTTVSILILALLDYCKEYYSTDTTESNEIYNQLNGYLFNDVIREDLKKKLLFNGDSDFAFQSLLRDRSNENGQIDNRFCSNYQVLLKNLKNRKLNPQIYLSGIQKLKIVDIEVEKEKDDAHLIFETVNGTGLELTGAELIKNYILMTVLPANQNNLYTDKWRPMELALGNDFDRFFRYYLIAVKQEEIENNDPKRCYEEFKTYAKGKNTEDLVRNEIFEYFECYKEWINASKWSTEKIESAIFRLRNTNNPVITPAVLAVLYRYNILKRENKIITDEEKKRESSRRIAAFEKEMVSIFNILEVYFVRFKLCEIDSKNIGDAWLKMLKALSKDCSKSSVCDVITAIQKTNQHMPTDKEVDNHLLIYNIYRKKRWCRYVLDRIEKHLNNDYSHDSQWSIEHILPQTPKSAEDLAKMDAPKKKKYDWITPLGEGFSEAMAYVHTIGNLTLSGYNSDYQNFYFTVKRDLGDVPGDEKKGYKYSTIRMSGSLKSLDHWDKDTIINRTKEMGSIIKKIWPYPTKP